MYGAIGAWLPGAAKENLQENRKLSTAKNERRELAFFGGGGKAATKRLQLA